MNGSAYPQSLPERRQFVLCELWSDSTLYRPQARRSRSRAWIPPDEAHIELWMNFAATRHRARRYRTYQRGFFSSHRTWRLLQLAHPPRLRRWYFLWRAFCTTPGMSWKGGLVIVGNLGGDCGRIRYRLGPDEEGSDVRGGSFGGDDPWTDNLQGNYAFSYYVGLQKKLNKKGGEGKG